MFCKGDPFGSPFLLLTLVKRDKIVYLKYV